MFSINQLVGRKIPEKNLREVFKKFLKTVGQKPSGVDISLAIVDDKSIKQFNRIYRKKNEVTDVLSFNYGDKDNINGEILISYPQAQKQAIKYKHLIKEEIQVLFAHGLLHLAGFKHNTIKSKAEMRRKEEEILGRGVCSRN